MKRLGCLVLLGASLFVVGCDTATTNPVNVPVTPTTEKSKPDAKSTNTPEPAGTKAL